MKIYIASQGDSDVGIHPMGSVISIPFKLDREEREYWRDKFQKLFTELHDQGEADVLFDDECELCGDILGTGLQCPNCTLEAI